MREAVPGRRRVKRVTGGTVAYGVHHGDPYVFPTGVAERQRISLCLLQDPVVRQPVPSEACIVARFLEHLEEAAGAASGPQRAWTYRAAVRCPRAWTGRTVARCCALRGRCGPEGGAPRPGPRPRTPPRRLRPAADRPRCGRRGRG